MPRFVDALINDTSCFFTEDETDYTQEGPKVRLMPLIDELVSDIDDMVSKVEREGIDSVLSEDPMETIENFKETKKKVEDINESLDENVYAPEKAKLRIVIAKYEYLIRKLHNASIDEEFEGQKACDSKEKNMFSFLDFLNRMFRSTAAFIFIGLFNVSNQKLKREVQEWRIFFKQKLSLSLIIGIVFAYLGLGQKLFMAMAIFVVLGTFFGRFEVEVESFNDLALALKERGKFLVGSFLWLAVCRTLDMYIFQANITSSSFAALAIAVYFLKIADTVEKWTGLPLFPWFNKIMPLFREHFQNNDSKGNSIGENSTQEISS